jgi:hypothetical protein
MEEAKALSPRAERPRPSAIPLGQFPLSGTHGRIVPEAIDCQMRGAPMLTFRTLACATVLAALLLAVITGLVGAWLGVVFADALAKVSFNALPI